MVREFCSKEEVFGGGSAPPLMGAGDGAEICFIFAYILTARRRINKLIMKRVENPVPGAGGCPSGFAYLLFLSFLALGISCAVALI